MMEKNIRIAIGGFGIESCTFSPLVSSRDDFQVFRGNDVIKNYKFLTRFAGIDIVPLIRAGALPGGPVDRMFYESVKTELLRGLREKGPWDGVFLHLHGAANVAGLDDAEGDLTAAVRLAAGAACMVAASYDLHGNLSPEVVRNIDIMSAYRTAPHVDVEETLERVFNLLISCIKCRIRPYKSFIPVPVLLPGERTSTEWQPGQGLYQLIPQVIGTDVLDASILIGYAWADEPRATASVFALGTQKKAVRHAALTLAQRFWDVRHDFQFGVRADSVDACIQNALEAQEISVVISDSGDNPTAGAAGDVPFVLERLLALKVPDAVYASLPDREAVSICHQAGDGAQVELSLGGKLDSVHGVPLQVKGRVLSIATRPWPAHVTTGTRIPNRQAVVQVQGIKVILTEQRTPFHTMSDFEFLNIDPRFSKILVVKIGYLEPELKRMAGKSLLALSPGAVRQDIENLDFKRLKRPIYPLDPDMTWDVTSPDEI